MPGPAVSEGSHELDSLWERARGQLQVELSAANFRTWVAGTRALALEDDHLTIEAPSPMACAFLETQAMLSVARAVEAAAGRAYTVSFVPATVAGAQRPIAARPAPRAKEPILGRLNCEFTFERYVQAAGNRIAYRNCRMLVEGHAPTPLVLAGPPGMGKTHLLHAMACRAAAAGWDVACLSTEEFANRYFDALRDGAMTAFHARVRSVRLLVIDDLHYFSGRSAKEAVQDELVRTIEAVTNGGGKVAVGTERHPAELSLIERLQTRLRSGLTTVIEPFTFEERLCYCRRFAEEAGLDLPGWAIERVAGIEAPSVRLLQGAMNVVVALSEEGLLDLARLDLELARMALRAASPAVCPERALIERIAAHFAVTYDEIISRARGRELATARAVAAVALHRRGRSLRQIAELFDNRNKGSIHDILPTGEAAIAADPAVARLLDESA
jgi:chromosomal replication initiator protein